MDAAFEFAINRPNMEFALDRIRNGHVVPAGLFIDIMTEKCQLINKHLRTTRDYLMIMASVTNMTASIKFHDIYLEDSEIRHVTLSNLPDLEEQLIHLWTEMCDLLRYYHIDDHDAKLISIDTFYSDLVYEDLVQANFML